MTPARKVALLVGLGGSAAALVALAVVLWSFLAPTVPPGTKEIQRLGCDSDSYVSALVAHGAERPDFAASIDCRVDESATPRTCAAVLAAYVGAAGHREGNVLVGVRKVKVTGGRRTYERSCMQVLAPDGRVVSSY